MQQPFGEDFARRIVEVQEAITDAMRPVVEAVARFEAQWRDVAARLPPPESILRLVETVAEGGRLALQRGLPANWRELDLADWERALRLGTEHGISVIWAPRVEIVRELIGAETEAERDRVLVEHRERILGDLESPLREATYDRFGHGPSMAWQALGALRDGHYAPAQSHAAAALTQLVHDNLGHAQLHDARRAFEQHDPMHVEMGMFRITRCCAPWRVPFIALTTHAPASTGTRRRTASRQLNTPRRTRSPQCCSSLVCYASCDSCSR